MGLVWFRRRASSSARPAFAAWCVAAAAVVALLAPAPAARAGDVESAKQRIESAKDDLKGQNWNSFERDLKEATEFLDGVPDADRKPIEAQMEALKKQAEPQIKTWKSKNIVDRVTRDIESAAGDVVPVPDRALTALKEITARLNSDDAKKYVDPAVLKQLQTRVDGNMQSAVKNVKKRVLGNIENVLPDLEKKVAANPFKDQPPEQFYNITRDLNGEVSHVRRFLQELPSQDDPDVKAVVARVTKVEKQIETLGGGAEKDQKIADVGKSWKNTQEYFAGWDKETTGPTWDAYTKTGSTEMSALLMPKTMEAITRVRYWLDEEQIKKTQEEYKDDPTLKATMAEATKTLDTAAGKVSAAFNKLLDEADKLPTPRKDELAFNKPGYMADDAKRWFEGTKYKDANVARATKLQEKWKGAVEGAEQAADATFKQLVQQASAAWPGIEAATKAEEGFNPAELDKWKGKLIKLKGVDNRSGWDFDAEYAFAMKIRGQAVAGYFAPNVKAALDDVYNRTKKGVGDSSWDVIAIVEGPGKIQERTSADVRDGASTIGRIEGHRPVDCTVIRIVGLHAGPVAVAPGPGAVGAGAAGTGSAGAGASGTTGTEAAAGAASGFVVFLGWVWRIISVLILLAAAGAAFIKARPASVAQAASVAPGASATLNAAPFSGDALGIVGIVFAVFGVLKLLAGCVIGDLLPSLALIAAGLYVASDFLRVKGILKDPQYNQLKPLGIPIAGATAVIALLHLVLGAHWVF